VTKHKLKLVLQWKHWELVPVTVHWHPRWNQVVAGCSDGSSPRRRTCKHCCANMPLRGWTSHHGRDLRPISIATETTQSGRPATGKGSAVTSIHGQPKRPERRCGKGSLGSVAQISGRQVLFGKGNEYSIYQNNGTEFYQNKPFNLL